MDLDELPQPAWEGTVDPHDLTSDGQNPNEMPDEAFDLLCERMRENGWLSGPIITDTDGVIADGEHRMRAAREIGLQKVPVRQYEIDDGQRRLWRQELNKIRGEHDQRADAFEYDRLLNDGFSEEIEELTAANDEDLEELLNDVAEAEQDVETFENAEQVNDPEAEWDESGAFDYENEDQTPSFSVEVKFDSISDVRDFRSAIGQDFEVGTDSIHYPERERANFGDKRYVASESDEQEATANE